MAEYQYVVIGGGMAADAAIGGIRRYDKDGAILVVSKESYPPYKRPPLTKGLWQTQRLEEVWLDQWHRQPGVRLLLNTRVTAIDRTLRTVHTQDGFDFGYQHLLIATGGRVKRLPGSQEHLYYPGDLEQHLALWSEVQEPHEVLVVGGGFVGAEMAAALSSHHQNVTWIVAEEHPFAGFLPSGLAKHVIHHYQQQGVQIVSQTVVKSSLSAAKGVLLETNRGRMEADLAVVGIGTAPNDTLWESNQGDGIVVDDKLQTDDPYIWAAGDVARLSGEKRLMPHEDHALTQGRLAGMNMAGANRTYTHMPFYYSDLFHFGYEAIGACRTEFDIFEDWTRTYEEGVVYYLDKGQVVGVLNWNVWDGIKIAEQLIARHESVTPEVLRGAISNRESGS